VIVGDPEQLPPTSVGERDGDEADDLDVPDQESILDECLAAHLPQHRLAWHYRSRHESLIAFSNRHYYRGGLITFPSPVTQDRALRLIPVADGLYERGGARVNRPEARAVVAEVLARLRDAGAAPCSLGIVTFNGEQQRLIENLLDAERRADPGLERHFDPRVTPEPVFVKNLETVQGDERDAILFSVAVGPDGAGRITGQISSLNRAGGHRRLNVAITRARRELFVFASLRPEQIDLGRGAARGIRDLKHFLDFAAHGSPALEAAAAPTGRDVESPFEASVLAALEGRGWRVVPQVGVSSFRIDLGIIHPDAPGRYLAGVECDGATYHSAATARDRDRLRQWVLTDLGWRLHRIWSTDWWIDAEGALDRLDAALRADLEADRAKPAPEAPPAASAPPAPYAVADLSGFAPDGERLHDPAYDASLSAQVAHVVAVEGPLFADLLVTRLMRAHALSRATARLRSRILGCLDAGVPRSCEEAREVLWPIGADPGAPVVFRPASTEARDPGDIPLPELAGLARSLGGEPDDLPARMARHLGLIRPGEATRQRLTRAVVLAFPADGPAAE
jgi:very-short-patch-repair endonuclease